MSKKNEVVIVPACRTAVGTFLGSLSDIPASTPGTIVATLCIGGGMGIAMCVERP